MNTESKRRVCCVCNEECKAPAAYRAGSGVFEGEGSARCTCRQCGMPVCSACSKRVRRIRLCRDCIGENERAKQQRLAVDA